MTDLNSNDLSPVDDVRCHVGFRHHGVTRFCI